MKHLRLATFAFVGALALSVRPSAQNMMLSSYPASARAPINRGDFNNDGQMDVIFCASTGGVGVAIAQSDGSLLSPRYSGTGNLCGGIAVGDFNHDGLLDVAMSAPNFGTSTVGYVQIYLGNGNGSFRLLQQLSSGGGDIVAGDFDRDGNLDLAVADPLHPAALYIYPGLGNGKFGAPMTVTVSAPRIARIRTGDFDNDGNTDIAVGGANSTASTIEVLFNNGNFSFTDRVVSTSNAYLVNTADLNQDGHTDLIAEHYSNCVTSPKTTVCDYYLKPYLSSGKSRLFINPWTAQIPGLITDAVAADLDGDGINDIVGVLQEGVWAMAVWHGHADATFDSTPAYYELGGGSVTTGVVAVDLNRDGRPDFAVVNASNINAGISTFLNAVPRAICSTYKASSVPTGCQPSSFTYSTPSVHFVANAHDNAHPVTNFQLFIDNKLNFSTPASSVDLFRSLPDGNHTVVYKETDGSGASFFSPHFVTVFSGTPGAVCSTAISTANICFPGVAPANNPVHILAAGYTPNTPTATKLYIDGQQKVSASNLQNFVNQSFTLSAGTHSLIFKVYDANGHMVTATKTITVK